MRATPIARRDAGGPAARFSIPVVTNGKVYVAANGEVDVYGLLNGRADCGRAADHPEWRHIFLEPERHAFQHDRVRGNPLHAERSDPNFVFDTL